MDNLTIAYQAGKQAYKDGKSQEDNPYNDAPGKDYYGSCQEQWNLGYTVAKKNTYRIK